MKIFATPRRASTIAVIKDSENTAGIEVLLMRRNSSDRFLPGYHVFPGGAVEEHDSPRCYGLAGKTDDEYAGDAGTPDILSHKICAVRETFEESGILFARRDGSSTDVPEHGNETLASYRKQVISGEIKLHQIMMKEKIRPSLEKLHYLSRWITPPLSPIRYDTMFFIASLPKNQSISHDGDELVSSAWISPREAMLMEKKGELRLVKPTISTIEFLCRFNSVNEAENYFLKEGVSSPAISS